MLNYRVNIKNIDKTKVVLPVTSIQFLDFNEIYDEENEIVEYNGINIDKIILTCECEDIDKLKNGTTINTVNTLILNYGTYTFNKEFKVNGVNEDNRSFSIKTGNVYTPASTASLANKVPYGTTDVFVVTYSASTRTVTIRNSAEVLGETVLDEGVEVKTMKYIFSGYYHVEYRQDTNKIYKLLVYTRVLEESEIIEVK